MIDEGPITQAEVIQELTTAIEVMFSGRIQLAHSGIIDLLGELQIEHDGQYAETIEWIQEALTILNSGRVLLAREHLKNLIAHLENQPPRFPADNFLTPRTAHVRSPRDTA